MSKMIHQCPACSGNMIIRSLACKECGLEIRTDFESNPFDRLDEDQTSFLLAFLKHQGKLNALQEQLGLSYPAAKTKLTDLLKTLGLEETHNEERMINVNIWRTNENSTLASEIIKTKLKKCGGKTTVLTQNGTPREIIANLDGHSLSFEKFNAPYNYEIFDIVVEFLLANGGRARKGNRRVPLGEKGCEPDTVAWCVGNQYHKKDQNTSYTDPVYMLAAVLDWAGIAHNKYGYIELTPAYKEKLKK